MKIQLAIGNSSSETNDRNYSGQGAVIVAPLSFIDGPLVEIESGLIRGAFGANVTLKCLFDSYPPVSNVTWYREETFDRLEGRLYSKYEDARQKYLS